MKAAAYFGRVWSFAFQKFTIRTDGMQIVAASLVPLLAPYLGIKNPSQANSEVLAYIGMAVLALILIRLLCAPYYIWKEDQATIDRLVAELEAPERRAQASMEEHRDALRRELGDKLADLVAFTEAARVPMVLATYSGDHLAKTTTRIAELISQLSYDVTLRVASINLQGLCLNIMREIHEGNPCEALIERLWRQRKLTFKIIHRQDDIHEIYSLAELENLIAEYGESFEPKDDPPENVSDARDSLRKLRKGVADVGALDEESRSFIRTKFAASMRQRLLGTGPKKPL
jgi:hypothetical protein